MNREEIKKALETHIGRRVRIEFSDGVKQSVNIGLVDDEGFLHSGPEGADPQDFWTRFESVKICSAGFVVEWISVAGWGEHGPLRSRRQQLYLSR